MVDTGGVLRQVYESVFLKIAKGESCNGVQMFQGPLERVLPSYRSSTILSEHSKCWVRSLLTV